MVLNFRTNKKKKMNNLRINNKPFTFNKMTMIQNTKRIQHCMMITGKMIWD